MWGRRAGDGQSMQQYVLRYAYEHLFIQHCVAIPLLFIVRCTSGKGSAGRDDPETDGWRPGGHSLFEGANDDEPQSWFRHSWNSVRVRRWPHSRTLASTGCEEDSSSSTSNRPSRLQREHINGRRRDNMSH